MKDNIKLNSDDLRMARELGIDLKDKEMVAELYRNKSKRVSAQAARRR